LVEGHAARGQQQVVVRRGDQDATGDDAVVLRRLRRRQLTRAIEDLGEHARRLRRHVEHHEHGGLEVARQ
jgi:hypothetical protein